VFARLGTWCHDRRRVVLAFWIAVLLFGNGIADGIGDAYRQDFSLGGFESTDGFSLVEDAFSDGSGSPQTAQIVFQADHGVNDPTVRQAMEGLFAQVAEIDDVTSVLSPYAPYADAFQVSQQGPAAGTIAFATVNLPEDIDFTGPPISPTKCGRCSRRSTACGSSWAAPCSPSPSRRPRSSSAWPSPW